MKVKKIFNCAALFVILLAAVIASVSCGKKGPPEAPEQPKLPVAGNLDAELRGGSLVLKWSLPEKPGEDQIVPAGFIVYRAKTPIGKDCPDCPVRFDRAGWVAYRSGRIVPDTWYFEDSPDSGHVYRYKVRSYSRTGRVGKASGTVSYTISRESQDGKAG